MRQGINLFTWHIFRLPEQSVGFLPWRGLLEFPFMDTAVLWNAVVTRTVWLSSLSALWSEVLFHVKRGFSFFWKENWLVRDRYIADVFTRLRSQLNAFRGYFWVISQFKSTPMSLVWVIIVPFAGIFPSKSFGWTGSHVYNQPDYDCCPFFVARFIELSHNWKMTLKTTEMWHNDCNE